MSSRWFAWLSSPLGRKRSERRKTSSNGSAPSAVVHDADLRFRLGDPDGAMSRLRHHVDRNPTDTHALLELARMQESGGEIDRALSIYRSIVREGATHAEPARSKGRSALFDLVMRECRRLKAYGDESIAVADSLTAIQSLERQIHLTIELMRTLEGPLEERLLVPISVTYNHAIASKAFLLWQSGRTAFAEAELDSPASDNDVPTGISTHWFPRDRWEMFSDLVAEHARGLQAREQWRDAAFAFVYARSLRRDKLHREIDETTVALLFDEAICELNDRAFQRAYEILIRLARHFPTFRRDDVLAMRERAHRGQVFEICAKIVQQATSAFHDGDWATAATRYCEAAESIEAREGSDFVCLAAECYFNAAMAHWNAGRVGEARRLLDYLRRMYPTFETERVQAQMAKAEERLAIRVPLS